MLSDLPARLVLSLVDDLPAVLSTLSTGTRTHLVPVILLKANPFSADETAVHEALVDETLRQSQQRFAPNSWCTALFRCSVGVVRRLLWKEHAARSEWQRQIQMLDVLA